MTHYVERNTSDATYDGARNVVQEEFEHLAQWRGRAPQAGLALSGGGIRSASYCLGVLQALAHERCLPQFDYLSTVSGGGYIGSSLSYLLHEAQRSGSDSPPFDTSKERFPYLSYPMVSAPMGTPEDRDTQRWKGRLLARLRQNAKFLAPGRGINVLSLIGVFLRNGLTSVIVHAAVIVLVMQILMGADWLPHAGDADAAWSTLLGTNNYVLLCAGALFAAYLAMSAAYVVLTAFFDPIEGAWPDGPYKLRRANDVLTFVLLAAALATLVVGVMPLIHHLLAQKTLPEWIAFLSPNAKDNPAVAGGISTALGLIGALWGFLRKGGAKPPKIPTGLIVGLASGLLLFGMLLLTYAFLIPLKPSPTEHLAIAGGAIAVLFVLGWIPDINYVSLHRFYRDRLMELFLPDLDKLWSSVRDDDDPGRGDRVAGSVPGDGTLLGELCGADARRRGKAAVNEAQPREKAFRGPYHIINTNVVLVASQHPRYRARGGDNYILSPLFSGSRATGWQSTDSSPQNGFTLATAMAASGAAVSPNAGGGGEGITRNSALSVLMGMFNVRLGYWCDNPCNPPSAYSSRFASILLKPNLINPGLCESLGRFDLHEQGRYVLLTDGGHFENLGIYELVRRRLKLIVACDATADPDFDFADLANAIEKVRADFGAIIDIDSEQLDVLVPRQGSAGAKAMSLAKRGYLVANIHYARPEDDAVERTTEADARHPDGRLIYLKPTFFKELSADLHGYRRTHPDFPNQSTGDQFFDEKQFESYRELGFQSVFQLLHAEAGLRADLTYPPPSREPPAREEPRATRIAAAALVMAE